MIEIIILSNEKEYYIKNITENLNLKNDIDTLGAELSFGTNINYEFNEGDIVVLKSNNKELLRGIIVDFSTDTLTKNDYTAYDFGFYLNENQVFYKFNNQSASDCIKKMLNDFNIPIGNIENISFAITKIYNGDVVSDVIKDIIEQVKEGTGKNYYFEMIEGKFNLFNLDSLIAEYEVNNETIITVPSHSRSIKELKNSIVITDNSEDGAIIHTVKDSNSISKYGQLQMVHSVGDDEKDRSSTIASNLLKENNKVSKKLSFDVVGTFDLMPARIIKVNLDKIKGNYKITSVNHKIESGTHITSLDLEVI